MPLAQGIHPVDNGGIMDVYPGWPAGQVPGGPGKGATMQVTDTTQPVGFVPRVKAVAALAAAPVVGLAYLAVLPVAVPAILARQAWSRRQEAAPRRTGVSRRATVERNKEAAAVRILRR